MKPEFMFVGKAEDGPENHIEAAIKLILAEKQKLRYDDKAKWLQFKGNDLEFLKTLKAKLQTAHRRNYGTSRIGPDIRIVPDFNASTLASDSFEAVWQFWYKASDY